MVMNRWTLSGKTALVTGATSGIGLAIADELIDHGATVIGVARTADRIERWAAVRGMRGIAADVASESDRARIFDEVNELDILVNNAGTNIRKPTADYSNEEYSLIRETNMDSVFALCRLAYPLLRASGDASIINVVSVASFRNLGTGTPYAMTKAAIAQIGRASCRERV